MKILKSCFSGGYNFKRIVTNENIFMSGTATFNDLGNGKYRYNENAIYVLHETPRNCFQTRFFVIKDTSLIIEKIDGSVLHEFQTQQEVSLPLAFHHVHQCKNDVYAITLTIGSINEFETLYSIKGSKKDEQIQTHYTRLKV